MRHSHVDLMDFILSMDTKIRQKKNREDKIFSLLSIKERNG